MKALLNPGRVAGLWYLLLVLLGPLRLIYIPGKLFDYQDAAGTIRNISAHEGLFRAGIAADLAGGIVLVVMALALYRLFERVDRNLAVMVVLFGGVMPALLYFVGVAADLGVLSIVHRPAFLAAFDSAQQNGLAVLLLKLRSCLDTGAQTLWGVWLFPLGVLVYRSRFMPRFLGVWLVVNGVAYVAMSDTGVLAPAYQDSIFRWGQPFFLAELALTLWLVIKGATPMRLLPADQV